LRFPSTGRQEVESVGCSERRITRTCSRRFWATNHQPAFQADTDEFFGTLAARAGCFCCPNRPRLAKKPERPGDFKAPAEFGGNHHSSPRACAARIAEGRVEPVAAGEFPGSYRPLSRSFRLPAASSTWPRPGQPFPAKVTDFPKSDVPFQMVRNAPVRPRAICIPREIPSSLARKARSTSPGARASRAGTWKGELPIEDGRPPWAKKEFWGRTRTAGLSTASQMTTSPFGSRLCYIVGHGRRQGSLKKPRASRKGAPHC